MSTTNDEAPVNEFATTKFIVRATILAVVVLAGVVFSGFFLIQRPPSVDTNVSACERPASTDTEATGRIPVDGYHPYGPALVPITPYGPSTTTPAPTCYEQSPYGASAAAAVIASLVTSGQTDIALDHLTLDTPTADDMREDTANSGVPDVLPYVIATRVDAYDVDTATIRVALEAPTTGFTSPRAALDFDLVWEDGWKWSIPDRTPTTQDIYSLNGYNPFDTPQEAPAHG